MFASSSLLGFVLLGWFVVIVIFVIVIGLFWRWLVVRGEQALVVLHSLWDSQTHAFVANSYVKSWTHRHAKALKYVGNRLSRKEFTGLPFTILALLLLYTLILLFGVTSNYLSGEPLVALDLRLDNLLFAFREPTLLRFFYTVTLFGESGIIIGMTLLIAIVLWIKRQRLFIGTLFLTLAVSEGMTFVAKILFHRERPDLALRAIAESSFSFPSGHATTAAAFYGFLAYLIIRTHKRWFVRVNAFFLALIAIFLIDLSRLYLGVHYLSDVLAGDLVGLAGLLFSISVTEWLFSKHKQKPDICPLSLLGGLGIALALIVAGVSLFTASPWIHPTPVTATQVALADIPSLFDLGKLPRYTESLLGSPQEPTDIMIVANDSCFPALFQKANWTRADTVSVASLKKAISAALFNQSDLTAPVTPSFYDARPNDFGFEKETDSKSVRARHHARFWKTGYATAGGSLFVGTVSLDTGIKWGITHAIAPAIDTERDLLVSDLEGAGATNVQIIKLVPPTLGQNFTGDAFFTDGKAVLLTFACNNP